MIKYLKKIQSIGVDSNTDLKSAKKIKLANTISIVGKSVGLIVLFYAYLVNWSVNVLLTLCAIIVVTFISPILNHYRQTVLSRIIFLLIANTSVITMSIITGKPFHFQYFLLITLCMPLIFFGNELGNKNFFLSAAAILFYIYLQWHFNTFEPLVNVDLSYANIIGFANDFIIFLMLFFYFYFFAKENEAYAADIILKSNELEEKNIQLEHYAYIASHDLNEPLRTVNSFVDFIQKEYKDLADKNLNTYFTFIRDALSRMRWMIDGMLNYSRIGRSGDYQAVDINFLIGEIKVDLGELIKQKNATIRASNLPEINCLQLEIRQLFQNLITNAIKFQQPDVAPIIEITQKEILDYRQFCVADNGIGISFKKHKMIFQMFTKLHLRQKYEGHGIRLAFCKKIVNLHKGKIWVESSPGNGSRFYFTIPKKYSYEKENSEYFINR